MRLFYAIVIVIAATAFTAGCAKDVKKSRVVKLEGTDVVQQPDIIKLAFLDSKTFDKELSSALKHDNAQVRVDVPSAFDLNDIPERMDRWLLQVQNSGGRVVAKPDETVEMRGAAELVMELSSVLADRVSDKMLYGPAGAYDTYLVYGADGAVREVIFELR